MHQAEDHLIFESLIQNGFATFCCYIWSFSVDMDNKSKGLHLSLMHMAIASLQFICHNSCGMMAGAFTGKECPAGND